MIEVGIAESEPKASLGLTALEWSDVMRRREFLRRMAVAGSGLVYEGPLAAFASQEGEKSRGTTPAVKSIRGLVEKDRRFFQPVSILLSPENSAAAEGKTAVVRMDGVAVDQQTIGAAAQMLEVLTPAALVEREANITVEVAGRTLISENVMVKPVRKVLVYVLPHSHNDIGYTDLQTDVEKKQLRNIQLGIDLARKTAEYPEGARFVWNMEGCWAGDLWIDRMPESDKAEFINAAQKGWLGLNGMYANELTGLCRPEELLQLFRYATRLGKQCGVKIDSAMISDVPGFTWGTATAMSQAGIRYFSAAPNWFDRIGTLMEEWQDKPFWWISPSGREKVLVWVPWTGYAMSHVFKRITPEWASEYQDRLDKASFRYDISYIRWSGHGDNAEPDPEICEDIKAWNAKYAWPKFLISSTSKAFAAFEGRYGKELPEFKGDLTPYWEDGAGSSALETGINRQNADRLVQAEALFAMSAVGTYPVAALTDAWRNVLLFSEHTWGAWNSVSDSENKFVKDQWEIKRSFAMEAARQSRELLARSIRQAAGSSAQAATTAVDVYNTTSWARTELVMLPKTLSKAGDRVTGQNGQAVLSQRLSTGDLAIWAKDVPPFCAVRYNILPGVAHIPDAPVKIEDTVVDNGTIRVRVDAKTGGISGFYYRGIDVNLADTAGGQQINEYLFLPGSNLADLQSNGPVKITVEENGPLVATLHIESEAPGCNKLVRKVRLFRDYVELINIVDKKRAPMNPNPGKGGPGEDWAQRGGKESVQFAFPFNVKRAQMRLDIPLAVMRPETDQLPGACKNWLPVGRWIDVANQSHGVTWVTLDAPLVEIGEVSARLLGSERNLDVWRKHIEPTQKFYSWAMNNHWGTNYCASQEGVVVFRYALRPHLGYDAAAASRFATGLSQPLLAAPATGPVAARSPLLRVEPEDVLVTALKPSDDGKAWIVRLFGASGQDRRAKLIWSSPQPQDVWLSDLGEGPGIRSRDLVTVRAWELVTLRTDRI
jgi:alpha-mannosidase